MYIEKKCDKCSHKTVCKYKDNYDKALDKIKDLSDSIEDPMNMFKYSIDCDYFNDNTYFIKTTPDIINLPYKPTPVDFSKGPNDVPGIHITCEGKGNNLEYKVKQSLTDSVTGEVISEGPWL